MTFGAGGTATFGAGGTATFGAGGTATFGAGGTAAGDPTVLSLVRRWSVDWLNGRHPEACEEILAPDYTLTIGGFLLGPRAEYIPATMTQLARYPGLCVTVHSVVCTADAVGIVFTEHGASARLAGKAAAWTGVSIFGWDGQALNRCFAEEDYYGRRRQLDAGVCDPIDPPAAAPWDATAAPTDPAAEQVVRDWLATPDLRSVPLVCDDEGTGQPPQDLLEVQSARVNTIFSAGTSVAFHASQVGRYVGGLDGLDDLIDADTQLELAGIVTVEDGRITGGRVVRDRLGTARALRDHVVPRQLTGAR